jgi:hypothetical protein
MPKKSLPLATSQSLISEGVSRTNLGVSLTFGVGRTNEGPTNGMANNALRKVLRSCFLRDSWEIGVMCVFQPRRVVQLVRLVDVWVAVSGSSRLFGVQVQLQPLYHVLDLLTTRGHGDCQSKMPPDVVEPQRFTLGFVVVAPTKAGRVDRVPLILSGTVVYLVAELAVVGCAVGVGAADAEWDDIST